MGVLSDYMGLMAQINSIVSSCLPEIARGLQDEIYESTFKNVYSYDATDRAMESRRYMLGDRDNLLTEIGDNEITITNKTVLQSGRGVEETPVVEEGMDYYRQPGPRPFMDDALEAYISSGAGDAILAEALRAAGFTAETF